MEEYNTYGEERQQDYQAPEQGQEQPREWPPEQEPGQSAPASAYAPGFQEGGYYHHGGQHRNQGEPDGPKRGVAGYVLTGVLSLLVGMALGGCTAAVVLSGIDAAASPSAPQEEPSGWDERFDGIIGDEWEYEWRQDWLPEDEEYQEPDAPREYEGRALPDFDGAVPQIADQANPVPEIVAHVSEGVVGVNVYIDEDGEPYWAGYGTGFVVSSEGYIITNYHVVQGADSVTVAFSDGEEVDAEVIGGDVNVDTAVLKVEGAGFTPLALGDSDGLRVGEFSVAIGNPSGSELAGSVTFGIISATSRSINIEGRMLNVIQTDAAINMGNSGGPLLNMDGQVVGITTAKNLYAGYDEYGYAVNAEGLGFAIPINDAMAVVEQIITQGHVERPGLGINIIEVTPEDAEYLEVPEGILIYSVTRNGPAHKAGIKVDDIVLEYDGIEADSQDGFINYVKALEVGDAIRLKVWRDGEELELEAVLGDMNEMGAELVGDRVSDLFE